MVRIMRNRAVIVGCWDKGAREGRHLTRDVMWRDVDSLALARRN